MNIMHRGARRIALRVLGSDAVEDLRVVYKWASEVPEDQRPFRIFKDGRTLYCWESDIAAAAQRPANSATKHDTSSAASAKYGSSGNRPGAEGSGVSQASSKNLRKSRVQNGEPVAALTGAPSRQLKKVPAR